MYMYIFTLVLSILLFRSIFLFLNEQMCAFSPLDCEYCFRELYFSIKENISACTIDRIDKRTLSTTSTIDRLGVTKTTHSEKRQQDGGDVEIKYIHQS